MNDSNGQFLPGIYVVATPIGNLSDLSERARHALAQADRVLCEDTRVAKRLFSSLGLPVRGERFDAQCEAGKLAEVIESVKTGSRVALIADAGTPAVSDPGSRLIRAAHQAAVAVFAVPGPSAVSALFSVSGAKSLSFCFRGFFPRKPQERVREIEQALSIAGTATIWFESPERVVSALQSVASCSSQARVVVAKELTKIYERIFVGQAQEVVKTVSSEVEREGARGEWCFLVEVNDPSPLAKPDESWMLALSCLLESGVTASEAARRVSQYFGVPRGTVYERALERDGKKKSPGT